MTYAHNETFKHKNEELKMYLYYLLFYQLAVILNLAMELAKKVKFHDDNDLILPDGTREAAMYGFVYVEETLKLLSRERG